MDTVTKLVNEHTFSELEDDQGVCYDHEEHCDDDFETDLESDCVIAPFRLY